MADRSKKKHIRISNNPEKVSVPLGINLCPLHKEATLGLLKWHIYRVIGWDATVLVPPYLQLLLLKSSLHVHLFIMLFHLVPRICYQLYFSNLLIFPEHHTNIQMPSTWMCHRSELKIFKTADPHPLPTTPTYTFQSDSPCSLPHLKLSKFIANTIKLVFMLHSSLPTVLFPQLQERKWKSFSCVRL